MSGFIKVSPPSLFHLAGNALPRANAAYLRQTGNCYCDDKGCFIDVGDGFSLPVDVLDQSIHRWIKSLVTEPIRRLYPYRDGIPMFSSDANRMLFNQAGICQNDIKALESDPSFQWDFPVIEKAGKALEDRKSKTISMLLFPDVDSLREYLIEFIGFSSECVYGLSEDQLELETDDILKTALIELGILNSDNLKQISRDELEAIARHAQTILDFPNQKERLFVEAPAGFSKDFLESFFSAIDNIDYRIGTEGKPLKEVMKREIKSRARNGDIPEFLLDAMPRDWQEELLFDLDDKHTSELFRRLLDKGLITAKANGKTILHRILHNQHYNNLEISLKNKDIDKIINTYDPEGKTPLYYFQYFNELGQLQCFDVLEKLLKAGANGILEHHSDGSQTTIWHPSRRTYDDPFTNQNYEKLINILLRFDQVKPWIDEPNQQGDTVLHRAVGSCKLRTVDSCKLETIKELINRGASAQTINIQTGENALHFAETAEMVALLIENGAKSLLHSCDANGDTPLLRAVRDGRPEVVEALCRHDANIQDVNLKTGENVLHLLNSHKIEIPEKMFKCLLNLGAQELMNNPDKKGNFPLHSILSKSPWRAAWEYATWEYQTKITMIKKLLEHGARSDMTNLQNGENIWHLATRNAVKEIMKGEQSINKILEMFDVLGESDAKIKINAQNAHGERPLDAVVSKIKAETSSTKRTPLFLVYEKLVAIATDSVDNKKLPLKASV